MPIKNYTTRVSAEKSVGEVMSLLARKGARKVMTEYDSNGEVVAVCFILHIGGNELPFSLPLRADSILKILQNEKKAGRLDKVAFRDVNMSHARKVGWRILLDWLDAQLALVEIGMAQMEEVFMPYLWSIQKQKTFYELSRERGMANLLPQLTSP